MVCCIYDTSAQLTVSTEQCIHIETLMYQMFEFDKV